MYLRCEIIFVSLFILNKERERRGWGEPCFARYRCSFSSVNRFHVSDQEEGNWIMTVASIAS